MKKSLFFILLAVTAFFSLSAYASGGYGERGEWGGHHRHHHGHHHGHHGYPHYREEIRYYPPRPYYREVIKYYPPRPRPYYRDEIRYYPQPPVVRPQPYPYFPSRDMRSASGLAGSMVGGAVGYEFGGGDPLAAGIGAAAGSYLGNGMDGR